MTSKMTTQFVLHDLPISTLDGEIIHFWFDGNSKVTLSNGDFNNPRPNAFSLMQIADCPFATSICKSVCYVHRLEEAQSEVYDKYRHNSQMIRRVLDDYNMREATINAFSEWISENCKSGFRWHISGDIFSMPYAYFIIRVCNQAPNVKFWIYTRSYAFAPLLAEVKNLVVNLSADADNINLAYDMHDKYGFRICYLTMDGSLPVLPEGSVIFPSHDLRGRDLSKPTDAPWWQSLSSGQRKMVCPPDFFGQSDKMRCGPCQKCLV